MSSFVTEQDEGAAIPAPATNSSGKLPNKLPPIPWPEVVAMFETTSEPKPASAPLIDANTTLEWDKATLLAVWLAMGGKEDALRTEYYENGYKMRDEPSDDVSEWFGLTVE